MRAVSVAFRGTGSRTAAETSWDVGACTCPRARRAVRLRWRSRARIGSRSMTFWQATCGWRPDNRIWSGRSGGPAMPNARPRRRDARA